LIAQLPPEQPVSLVGHSLGARTVASTLQLLATGQSEGYQLPQLAGQQRRVRAVFAAGAVDHHLLNPGERYGNALSATEGLLNLRNSDDLVLTLYPLHRPFTVPPLGRIGLTSTDRWQLGEWNSKITELELSPMLGRRHLWEHFYHQPRLAAAMAPYVYFADSPLQFSTGGPSTYQRQAGPQTAPAQGRDVLRQVGAEAPEKHGVLPGLNLNSRLLPRR
jgi:pimeloyl-ACP methyl ester carboxylesterase